METKHTSSVFQVVLIQPEGYAHSAALSELAETLLHGLAELGVELQFSINDFLPGATPIVLRAHLLDEQAMHSLPAESIIYNSEQIVDESIWIDSAYLDLLRHNTVWDYSHVNIQRLRQLGILHAKQVPVGYVPQLTRIPSAAKDIDVLFYGAINERRKKILEALIERGLRIEFLSGVYREERDRYIARAKVVLNMHYYETSVLEIVRISYLLANEVSVVTECNDPASLEPDIQEAVHAVPYGELVDACVDLANDARKRVHLGRRGFEIFSQRNEADILAEALGILQAGSMSPSRTWPSMLNLGSGRDWQEKCLNVDINAAVHPDALLDIAQPLESGQLLETTRFGNITLSGDMFDAIFANDVLEHIPDLKTAMTNCLGLLKPGGTFHIHVPYEFSSGAWRDPTHVRAFNEDSWVYYTDWFWYMNWTEARFDLLSLTFELNNFGEEMRTAGRPLKEILRTPRAVDGMNAILRKRYLLESEIEKGQSVGQKSQQDSVEDSHDDIAATPNFPDKGRNNFAAPQTVPYIGTPVGGDYARWITTRQRDETDSDKIQESLNEQMDNPISFEFILRLKPGTESLLADSIDSIAQQRWGEWCLSIFAHTPSPEPEFIDGTSAVRWIQVPEKEDFADAINERLNQTPASWIAIFACGTQFSTQLLQKVTDQISTHPKWRLVYCDEDTIDVNQQRDQPQFKPDFNLELLRSTDYIGGIFVERNALLSMGGYSRIPEADAYDTILRTADHHSEESIGHIADVLCHLPQNSLSRVTGQGALQALHEHFGRRGISAEIRPGNLQGITRRIIYHHSTKPKVSIIIPTRNRLDLLGPCIESLLKKTRYPDWELLIINNGSDDTNVTAYYETLCHALPEKVRLLNFHDPFNYSAMNNLAARAARGEYLLLLNNDTECLHDDWLDTMMNHGLRDDVGIVGARLLFPGTKKLQHAGVVLGMRGAAGHPFVSTLSCDDPGYLNRAQVDQEYSAVTGACLLIRKTLFEESGGLDEEIFKISFNDIDLCLKIRQKNYRIIWTPFATLLHHGSATQLSSPPDQKKIKVFQQECDQFYLRWPNEIASDPAWNPNLSLVATDPVIEGELSVSWNEKFHDRPRILVMPSASLAIAEYRNISALRALQALGKIQYIAVCQPRDGDERAPTPVELRRIAPDTLFMNAPVDNVRGQALQRYRHFNDNVFRIFTLDDLITHLPIDNPNYHNLPANVIRERMELGLAASHRLIVSTKPLAEAYRHLIDDVHVVPNSLSWSIWGQLQSQRRRGKKMRVGWAGAQQHAGDLRLISKVVRSTHREVDWIFFGMLPAELHPYVVEFHDYLRDFPAYPAKLASLDLDLAIAPLENHPFNEAKSNLRLLEYGILGWPVICTDIFPYRTDNPPVTRLPNDPARWISSIREKIADPQALAYEGDALREWVKQHYLLENRLEQWLAALTH